MALKNLTFLLMVFLSLFLCDQVEFSLSYTKRNDICLVIFNPETVYVYCGAAALEDVQIIVANKLAKIIIMKMGSPVRKVTILRSKSFVRCTMTGSGDMFSCIAFPHSVYSPTQCARNNFILAARIIFLA